MVFSNTISDTFQDPSIAFIYICLLLQVKLHAPYHRIDALFGSPEGNLPAEVCALERHFVSFKESVIKVSIHEHLQFVSYFPWVSDSFDTLTSYETLNLIIFLCQKFV